MAHQREPKCIGITASLHLQQKLHLKLQQKSLKK